MAGNRVDREVGHNAVTVTICAANITSTVSVSQGMLKLDRKSGRYTQTVTLKNGDGAVSAPVSLVLDNLISNATLFNATGWTACATPLGQLCVQRSVWKGHTEAPKGGRLRYVPLTQRLTAALQTVRHLRGPLVFCDQKGQAVNEKIIGDHVDHEARAATLQHRGIHILRHTFCSHLAMRRAPARAIQELAGHADLKTTQRYMHLSPAAVQSAIRLLERASH